MIAREGQNSMIEEGMAWNGVRGMEHCTMVWLMSMSTWQMGQYGRQVDS